MKYRKKPVVIEAEQFTEEMWKGNGFLPEGVKTGVFPGADTTVPTPVRFFIETLEGDLNISVGDWIITGVKGERYPCKPDIFEITYEPTQAGE